MAASTTISFVGLLALAIAIGGCKMSDTPSEGSPSATTNATATASTAAAKPTESAPPAGDTDGADGGLIPPTGPESWDGKTPFSCMGQTQRIVRDVKVQLPGTAIHVGGRCFLTLKNVDVTADVALEIAGLGRVTVEGGSLHGLVKASGLTHMVFRKVDIAAEPVAIEADGRAQFAIDFGSIKGATAINALGESRFVLSNVSVTGEKKKGPDAHID